MRFSQSFGEILMHIAHGQVLGKEVYVLLSRSSLGRGAGGARA
jgi:hypothetical protein